MTETTTRETEARIARLSRRSAASEATLIMTAGVALLAVVQFWFAEVTFLPVSVATGLPPTAIWILGSFLISGVWAVLHYRRIAPRIQAAKDDVAARLYEQQKKRRAEVAAQIAARDAETMESNK